MHTGAILLCPLNSLGIWVVLGCGRVLVDPIGIGVWLSSVAVIEEEWEG